MMRRLFATEVQPKLVAAREEHPVRFLQNAELFLVFTRLARVERQHPHLAGAHVAERFFVTAPGFPQFRGGRDHGDACIAAPAHAHEPAQDTFIADSRLGAANRDDEAACATFGNSGRTQKVGLLGQLSVKAHGQPTSRRANRPTWQAPPHLLR